MSYTIKYTETGNVQKPDITVEDQTLNQQLPVTFVGKIMLAMHRSLLKIFYTF